MRIISLFLVILNLLCSGCADKKVINGKCITVDGYKYKLIRVGKPLENYISDAELWERVGVTNRYYTPSADGKTMISIAK